jgi:hypothetical protein
MDPKAHANLTTPNFHVLGYDPLLVPSQGNKSAGGYLCGEVAQRADGRKLAVVNSYTTDVAFVLVDVTDAAHPTPVGEYLVRGTHAYDVAMTPDGKHVVVANDPDIPPKTPSVPGAALPDVQLVQPMWRDACTGETRPAGPEESVPLGPSTILVGIEDPKSPVFEDVSPAPLIGPHSVSTARTAQGIMVISSTTNLVHDLSYYEFFLVQDTPLGPKLALQSIYQAPPPADPKTPIINGHVDASVAVHPITKRTLAYLADWDAGVIVLDITDPRTPTELGSWSPFTGGPGYVAGIETGNIHSTYPINGTWDGHHYVMAGQEIVSHPKDHPSGYIFILDDTDPAHPTLAGKWTLPVQTDWGKNVLLFSTHYVAVVNRTLFVTVYHGGLWAADLSTPQKIADPPSVGVFVPDKLPPAGPPASQGVGVDDLPNFIVLDVLPFADGTMAVYDATGGVYMLRYDDAHPMPAPPTWTQLQAKGG